MIPFGLVNRRLGPAELKDARLPLTGFSLIVIAGALFLAETTSRRRWRIFQVVVILPSGALPMVTGGDDLPVIADAARTRSGDPPKARLVRGGDGSGRHSKFTVWPLLILLFWASGTGRVGVPSGGTRLAAAAVVVPVLGVGVGLAPHAFILNAIRFPLGLTRVKSPCGQPTLWPGAGQTLPGGQAGVDNDPYARRPHCCGLWALEVAALDPAECGRLQRSRHAARDTSRPGNPVRVPHLPAGLADLGRAARSVCLTHRGRPPRS